MDPNNFDNINNGYYNLQPPTAQNMQNIQNIQNTNVNTIPNYNNDFMMYNNTFSLQHANMNMFSNKNNSQFYPTSYAPPQNVGHFGQQISPNYIGNTSGNSFGNTSLPFVTQREFSIPGFKIKIIIEPILPISNQQHLTNNNPF
ncbi:uncharacterized protein OCT59_013372 [Rhizophagus irregularis]|uniref:Uncharacterized protein n=2 Tax=Rhizophagus irregularis TaxID=588596 RepID=U9U547_RHIID|nr:hypothetical protein GLOIN_2v1475074 [Rhizophagus irregularis DAOM 181602=DAOM 197198]EXX58829.1 hypothetical protein RirG_194330 [Rhizophagus irregularis DAOM 197198w]UZO20963.1 hypothetical protein OCT59_013372 [Rhizophagus irregularis]POG75866.1 hypothetical protein GLOIN_2v1475074 [Rhizophagus irregularis DAOM 181602=DAOM 197198]CAG8580607.1 10323_t:CDS:1 [Rhizophagus irregularis]GBC27540.1 hypothetical protein GLOIN_2v1475074 [Rhizophagus irregularis DAOM 181602=DAOM 197198]|eukprot:XP_025182732.1 hypothetical protein GLOIN_2v1475074 [Rhizophagus irregularis DAOM 181602=DAOM 197198]